MSEIKSFGFNPPQFADVQGSAKRWFPDLVNFVIALAYHICLALPAAFRQPGNHLLAEPCTLKHWSGSNSDGDRQRARADFRSVDSVPIILKGVLGPLILLRDGGMVGAPFGKNLSHISTPLKKSKM